MSTTRFIITTANVATSTTPSDRREVLAEDGVDRHEAEAVEVEDALGDHRAADEERDVEPEHRHDRRQAGAQPVPEDHALLGQPLGAGRADVVLAHGVEQVAAHHARVDRSVQQREHDPREYQVRRPLLRILGQRRIARPGGEIELVPEEEQRHQAEPEDRRRDAEERETHGEAVEDRTALDRRDDADQNPGGQPDQRGACDQRERPRRLFDDLGADRHARVVRVSEARPAVLVAGDDRLHELRRTARTRACRGRDCGVTSAMLSGVGCLPTKRSAGSPGGSL